MLAPVTVIGGGGHAKVVIATLQEAGHACLRILDDDRQRWGTDLMGIRVDGPITACRLEEKAVLAIGDNRTRKRIAETVGADWVSVVHPGTHVHPSVKLGRGTVIFAGCVIQPDADIGDHVIVNTGSLIDHDAIIGNYVHIAPGCALAGSVVVEEGAFLGIGTSVIPGKRIGAWATVGAGAVVVRDIPGGITAVGVPAVNKSVP